MARYLVRTVTSADFATLDRLERSVFGAMGEAVLCRHYLRLCCEFFADSCFGRHAIRAGIGFNLAQGQVDLESTAGRERALAHFERFQQLVGSEWRQMLADWMGANGGFIQYGTEGPALDMLPKDAVNWLATTTEAPELGWVFCGRWLFADRGADAEIMESAAKLTRTLEQTFSDLLPLWTSVYRH